MCSAVFSAFYAFYLIYIPAKPLLPNEFKPEIRQLHRLHLIIKVIKCRMSQEKLRIKVFEPLSRWRETSHSCSMLSFFSYLFRYKYTKQIKKQIYFNFCYKNMIKHFRRQSFGHYLYKKRETVPSSNPPLYGPFALDSKNKRK